MKTLDNHTLIYDTDCPMCRVYTKAFIKTGMLDREGRVPYNELDTIEVNVDRERARDEIALVDKVSGRVRYGLDSLSRILVPNFPFIGKLLRIKWIRLFFLKLYAFISHNRKVIAPSDIHKSNACVPSEHVGYKVMYLIFSSLVVITILSAYSVHLTTFYPKLFPFQEAVICLGQFVFQWMFIFRLKSQRILEYFGNMMTVSLMGALALAPFACWPGLPEYFYLGYFMLVVTFMFFEHVRRIRLLHLSFVLSITWALYRLLVLLIILNL